MRLCHFAQIREPVPDSLAVACHLCAIASTNRERQQTSCCDSAAFPQHITPRDDTWDTTDDVRVSDLDLMLLPASSSSAASASPTDSTAVTFPDPTALLASNLSESQTADCDPPLCSTDGWIYVSNCVLVYFSP